MLCSVPISDDVIWNASPAPSSPPEGARKNSPTGTHKQTLSAPPPPRDQKYAWGKPGDQSVVASLKAAGDSSYQVDVDQPYAEMWIGTHPSGPSNLLTNSGRVGPLLKVTWLCTQHGLEFFRSNHLLPGCKRGSAQPVLHVQRYVEQNIGLSRMSSSFGVGGLFTATVEKNWASCVIAFNRFVA